MDQDRQIRFAIPPFFLFASLLWGAYLGGRDLSPIFRPETAKEVLGLLAAAAVAVVPIGFLISTLSVTLLRGLAAVFGNPTYEAVLSDSTLERVWNQLAGKQTKNKKLTLYAAATFDHELLAAGIHTWLLRRWDSFNVATHSIVALAPCARSSTHFQDSAGLCLVDIDCHRRHASSVDRAQRMARDDDDDRIPVVQAPDLRHEERGSGPIILKYRQWANIWRNVYHGQMEEGRKRVLAIVAGILVARHLKTTDDLFDCRPSPRTESLITSAVQWAERIMRRIDGVHS
jgi:hypothetical protein